MDIIKIAAVGISGVVLCMIVKEACPEYALYLSVAAGLCILFLTTGKFRYLLEMLQKLEGYIPIDSASLRGLMKMIGIAYVGQFAAGLCRDAGYSSIAGQIELFGKVSILAISMPILSALMDTIQGLLS